MSDEVLFISDLHLDKHQPLIAQHFLTFIKTRAVNARVLYILGDLFETWLGDDDSAEEFGDIFAALQNLAQTAELYFLHGNRDFLVGDRLAQHLGFGIMADPAVIQLGSRRVALMHGDLLCSDDREYQAFRQQVRNIDWQREFLARPLTERQAIAARLREQSGVATAGKPNDIMDVNPQTVLDTFERLKVDTLIHGHTHRPGIHSIAANKQRIVLGDWNPQPSYLSWKDGEFTLIDARIQ